MEQRLIVELGRGPLQGKKACLAPGERLRVGRTDFAQWVVPHDEQMSAQHFELVWDGQQCILRDLGSVRGTFLAGRRIEEARVSHGGWIHAGDTDFLVFFEGHLPAATDDDERDEVREALAESALKLLRVVASHQKLYALMDAGRDVRVRQVLRQNVEEARSLYEGLDGETLADVAPYLVGPLAEDSRLLDALVREGWGKRWGMYCTSTHSLKDVRRHFRRFLKVEREDSGERMYFRFYDPGVMRVFWPTCTRRQKEEWMVELDEVFVESDLGAVERLRLPERG